MNLKDELKDWTDLDIAFHIIASKLSMVDQNSFAVNKKNYWTENKYKNFLQSTLNQLIELKVIAFNADENTVRYNSKFKIE